MRTFIALNLPPAERQRLYEAAAPLREKPVPIRWLDAESLHVTLKFIGDIEGAEMDQLERATSKIAQEHGPVTLQLGGLGAFPSLRRANIVWVGTAPDPALERMQRDLELALSRLGYTREQRPFRAHVTIGRVRSGARAPDVERLSAEFDYTAAVDIGSIDLMRSHPGPNGSRYEALLRRTLTEKVNE